MSNFEKISENQSTQLSKFSSVSTGLLITNLIFIFSLSLLFLNSISHGRFFSSTSILTATSIFILLNIVALTMFSMALSTSLESSLEDKDDLSSKYIRLKSLVKIGIAITSIGCVFYSLFLSFIFFGNLY